MSDDQGWADQAGTDEGDAQAAAVAMFVLNDIPGLSINVDDYDNEAGHAVLHTNSGTMASFSVSNVGGAAGTCTVDIEVDGNWITKWTSQDIGPGGGESAEVRGLGRHAAGYHDFLAYVNPGAGHHDHLKTNVSVAED